MVAVSRWMLNTVFSFHPGARRTKKRSQSTHLRRRELGWPLARGPCCPIGASIWEVRAIELLFRQLPLPLSPFQLGLRLLSVAHCLAMHSYFLHLHPRLAPLPPWARFIARLRNETPAVSASSSHDTLFVFDGTALRFVFFLILNSQEAISILSPTHATIPDLQRSSCGVKCPRRLRRQFPRKKGGSQA